jgi:hypothetical protein
LLQSFLQSRPGGSSGSGEAGSNSSGNKNGQGQGSEPNGEGADGSGKSGGTDAGSRGAADDQASLAEALDRMAEGADDGGGAATRLRTLAEEARDLEAAVRKRSQSREEIERRQERFQGRLLDAAKALEEKGEEEKRESSQPLTRLVDANPWELGDKGKLLEKIREKKRKAISQARDEDEKSLLERYYRELETR